MEMVLNAVSWFEVPVVDFERAKKFYSTIFDFEMPEMNMGPNKMGVLLHDRDKGGVGGVIIKGEGYSPSDNGVVVYLNCGNDLSRVLGRVENSGGKVLTEKINLGQGMGCIAYFTDCEGNKLGLYSIN